MEAETKTRKVKKNIYQKLAAFKAAIQGGESQAKAAEEQEVLIFFDDDIIPAGSVDEAVKKPNGEIIKTLRPVNYCKSTIHFVDLETGDEVTASSVCYDAAGNGDCTESRAAALRGLIGNSSNKKQPKPQNAAPQTQIQQNNTAPQSPTPARQPAEPARGGVPQGFTGFPKK